MAVERSAGRKAFAALPVEHPREFATALGRVTLEVWGPPGIEQQRARAWLPSFACPMVRNTLELVLRGDLAGVADLLIIPHTCDSLQTAASQVIDLGAGGLPAVTFYHPRALDAASRARFLRDELRRFRGEIERLFGPIPDEALERAVGWHRESDGLAHRLLREGPREGLAESERYAVLRSRERLWVGDQIDGMRGALGHSPDPGERGAPIMASGIVPEPPGLLDAIHDAGLRVAFDDFAGLGRRIPERLPDRSGDAMEDIARRYESLAPCTTRTAGPSERIDWIVRGALGAGARAALFVVVARCEPELFDLAAARDALRKAGVPSAVIETDMEGALPASIATRIEAFAEMVRGGGKG